MKTSELSRFEVARFYGWTLTDIDELTYQDYVLAIQAMRRLSAQETLLRFSESMHPHIKDSERKKRHKSVYQQAFPVDTEATNTKSLAEYAKILAQRMGLNG